MASTVAQFLLVTGIFSILLAVAFAVGSWQEASRSTRKQKSTPEPSTPISDANYAKVQAEMAELYVTLEKLTTTVKRSSSRHAMQDRRERETGRGTLDSFPIGTPKATLLRAVGMSGKLGPDFARAQQQLELEQKNETTH